MKALILMAAALGGGVEFAVQPRVTTWKDLSPEAFDLDWCLPTERRSEGRDLLVEMERLTELRFEARDRAGRTYRTLGDLMIGVRSVQRPQVWLQQVLASAPDLEKDWGAGLRELVLQDQHASPDWDPDEDGDRDGLLVAEAWNLTPEGLPWRELEVVPNAQQGATVILADLETIKAAENDFRNYPENPGASYEEIYPVDGGYLRGKDPAGRDFAAVKLFFRSELPLWYPDYRCDLRMLNTLDARGRLVCHIYSTSGDFHWLAGRDVYLPLDTSGSEDQGPVGYLVVRQYGFDLDGVPDKDKHVRAALRASLGSLKRRAQELAGPDGTARTDRGRTGMPEFQVVGKR